ncbi:uncharacterized protein [Physcomitrium patens]|uniref:Calcineurin-like phosphoesterase domain-containing protein n=2 Tax=Physcomitrium patens TaxID=3218 RepID=A0A2K1IC31_PHYPA|nr:uncharacterized protein LOC112277818 isoform X2 [Physcomitrium patens]PNR26835.1 hypothetical protein PHYPA_030316 [Physcomitrium patens]|eukprot:XP_024366334.1 uncharacterized protein LOC112277818 isoform X2 [Physcomitrella patens]
MAAMTVRIAIVGDVHDDWHPVKDSKALHLLKPDVVLFTGDFGNENVDLVRDVSKLDFPKAAILGNHDCWETVSPFAPYMDKSDSEIDKVQEQLELLGDVHVGFGRLDFPALRLSVVGGRPFSMGGERIHSAYNPFAALLGPRFGVHSFRESAQRMVENAKKAPPDSSLVFLAHNGPRGLGSKVHDICGRDWVERGGDHGDPDFEEAIAKVKQEGIRVPLVVFGHMHQQLQRGNPLKRTMLLVGPDKTIYLNAAVVPRVRGIMDPGLTTLTQRHFVLVEFQDKEVESIHEVWVTVGEDDGEVRKTLMYSRPCSSSME